MYLPDIPHWIDIDIDIDINKYINISIDKYINVCIDTDVDIAINIYFDNFNTIALGHLVEILGISSVSPDTVDIYPKMTTDHWIYDANLINLHLLFFVNPKMLTNYDNIV